MIRERTDAMHDAQRGFYKMEIIIPFMGFYQGHETDIEHTLEQDCSDDSGDLLEGLDFDQVNDSIDWQAVYIGYSKLYTEGFKNWINENGAIELDSLTFKELDSPKEYNFATDRIICDVSLEDIIRLYSIVDKKLLIKTIEERHTSRSGFYSFYSNDVNEWPILLAEWDSIQLETLLIAYCNELGFYSDVNEYYLMEDSNGNGDINSLLWDNMTSGTVNYLNSFDRE